MPRQPSLDTRVGELIRQRREARGWSIRYVAERAGIAHTTLSRIERGIQGVDNRFLLARIAEALECSTADLTGGPALTSDLTAAAAQASVAKILAALVEIDLADPATLKPRPLPVVAQDAELVWDLRLRCDYAGAARMFPGILRELHAHTHGADRARALRLLVRTADAASFVVRYLGFAAEAWLASERSRHAAQALADPVMLGLSAWSLGHAATGCGAYARALRIAETAAAAIEAHRTERDGLEMHAQLQMLAAYAHLAVGDRDQAMAWAAESQRVAELTGDVPTLGLNFGPTNFRVWRISMEVDGGDPALAVDIARGTNPSPLTVSRQAAFYTDTARALTMLGGHDTEAVRWLGIADRNAPTRVRANAVVRETVRTLSGRVTDRAAAVELRGLAERIGLS
jgi:transcriptional regulator with XRE-family HTH domain